MSLPQAVISDRRGHQRHAIHTDATLVLADGRALLVQMLDIGLDGAAVVADINPPGGCPLLIRVHLPARPTGHRLFEAQAVVASSILAGTEGGFRVGLQFKPLDAAAVIALRGLLP